ncbi:MAG: BrnT family toxin [Treponema sp.]|jgi:uncharacterized DUF497 family protein|nr:BrnT family toxin [Treponema sp.]
MNLQFEWDEEKDIINQVKHGISFEDATKAFYDPNFYELYDGEHSLIENRWKGIGLAGGSVLTVCFTERNKVIRIISARKAKKKEEKEYLLWLW